MSAVVVISVDELRALVRDAVAEALGQGGAAAGYYVAGQNPLGLSDPRSWARALARLEVPGVRLSRGRLACRREDLDAALARSGAPAPNPRPKKTAPAPDPFARALEPRRLRRAAR